MIRRVVVGLAVIAGMLGAGPVGPARAEDVKQPPDLTGQWRLDPKRSDAMQRPSGDSESRGGGGRMRGSGGRGGFGGTGGGGMGGPGGMGGGGMGAPAAWAVVAVWVAPAAWVVAGEGAVVPRAATRRVRGARRPGRGRCGCRI